MTYTICLNMIGGFKCDVKLRGKNIIVGTVFTQGLVRTQFRFHSPAIADNRASLSILFQRKPNLSPGRSPPSNGKKS